VNLSHPKWCHKRAVKRLILFVISGLLIAAYESDYILFAWPAAQQKHYEDKLGDVLRKQDLLAAFSFDEPVIKERVFMGACGSEETRCVPGRFGNARSFAETDSGMVWSSVRWSDLGTCYSISMWVKIPRGYPNQAIMFWTGGTQKTGLMLSDGHMMFAVPGQKSSVLISYPFESYDHYVHISASVDSNMGIVRLYEDGELKAEGVVADIYHHPRRLVFGKLNDIEIGFPFRGEIDETLIWARALSLDEIQTLGLYSLKLKASVMMNAFMRAIPKYVELINPLIHNSHLEDMALPSCDILLSGSDQRFFNQQHNGYLKNRTFTEESRKSRRVKLAFERGMVDARMTLIYPAAMTSSYHRMSFLVELDPEVKWRGMTSFVLLPPEDHGMLMPKIDVALAQEYGLPVDGDGFVLMRVNGSIRGGYYCASYRDYAFDRLHRGLNTKNLTTSISRYGERVLEIYDENRKKYGPLFANDTFSGCSAREAGYRLKSDRRRLAAWMEDAPLPDAESAQRVIEILSPYMIKGENISLLCLTTNLPLEAINFPNIELTWSCTLTNLITERGKVIRPSGTVPVAAELTLVAEAEGMHVSRTYQVAVQPKDSRVSVVHILSATHPNGMHRIPCVAEILGGNFQMPQRSALIRMRGNSAIFYAKKSYSLRMDQAHHVFNNSNSHHLYLVGCGEDPSLLRNKLAYDLFRDFSMPGKPRFVSQIRMVELVFNGEYMGIYQLTQRVDRHMLGWLPYSPNDERHNVLYKSDGPLANFLTLEPEHYQQKEPDENVQPYWGPYVELIQFIGQSSSEEFCEHIDEYVDIDNVVDFHLFLLFSNNSDGYKHNLYLARSKRPQNCIFIIPWDYDIAFRNMNFLSNGLFERLANDLPEYNGKLKKRWAVWRRSLLQEDSLNDRIDAIDDSILPVMSREKTYGLAGDQGHADAVEDLKEWIAGRLSDVDQYIENIED